MGRTVPGSTHLRNRNRITNKSRLRVVLGNYESDLVVADEEDDKARLLQQTAGVDADDANEHHLQAVLSAASQRHSRKSDKDKQPAPTAYIPTPESRGTADNWQELYPTHVWKDPVSFVCSSTTADEAITNGLDADFTYYMDERDKDWLDRNNEEARGEGTSAQGAMSSPTVRSPKPSSSSKAKGKDPEALQPVVISEDDFELVMSIFERVTHEKTEFLHHSLQTGMTFPEFSVYADTFGRELPHTFFSNFVVPDWIPKPHVLLRIAQLIYPHWKERREDRQGHRIIPMLNFDESDTLNESYICFRRREVKSVRKTRASQVSSSEKLARLQGEMQYALRLSQLLIDREKFKKESAHQAQQLSHTRVALVDLKCKFPSMSDPTDIELLIDKERPAKKPETIRGLKIKPSRDDSMTPGSREFVEKPKDRHARMQLKIDAAVQKQKEANALWEDHENMYQSKPGPPSSKAFRYYEPSSSSPSSSSDGQPPRPVAARCRRGRGGRFFVDRRPVGSRSILHTHSSRSRLFDIEVTTSEDMAWDALKREREENLQRAISRHKFDDDDGSAVPFGGIDEQDRILVDDMSANHMRHSLGLIGDQDWPQLQTDATIHAIGPDGKRISQVPYKLGIGAYMPPSRPGSNAMRISAYQQQVQISQSSQASGSPLAMQLKKAGMPSQVPQMRISSNGGMPRPISSLAQQSASSSAVPQPQMPPPNGLPHSNGAVHVAAAANHTPTANGMPHATLQTAPVAGDHDMQGVQTNGIIPSNSPPRTLPLNNRALPAGYWPNNYAPAVDQGMPQGGQFIPQQPIPTNPLTIEQQNKLRAAFNANPQGIPPNPEQAALVKAQYLQALGGNPNGMKLQLPQQRQMQQAQWTAQQRPLPVNGRMMPNGQVAHSSPSPVPPHAGSPPLHPSAPGLQQPQQAVPVPTQTGY
ncbi:enhancer of polycomb-like-domain-containing protein [Flagelloscypha sp. PMI_526]|nr:enhancer of polycomb-like-domain-containing protein [Flagelloscypha sp. PMI_526]